MGESLTFGWKRLLLGSAPWSFLFELLPRVVLVYLALIIVVRLFGKRLSGRIGNLELAVIIALGAIVAVPIQDPTRGVLPGVLLLASLVGLQRLLAWLEVRHAALERAVQGQASPMVIDGRLELEQLRAASVSVEQLFAVLRGEGLRHLGEAKRVYLEACGSFSVYRAQPPKPGLSLSATWDERAARRLKRAPQTYACRRCAELCADTSDEPSGPCPRCGAREWSAAVAGS